MSILKVLLKMGHTKMVKFFLNVTDISYLDKLKKPKLKEFIELYLQKDFRNKKDGLEIVNYLKKAFERKVFSASELDQLLVQAKYFETMPNDMVELLIKKFEFCSGIPAKDIPNFVSKMTSRINDSKILIELMVSYCYVDFTLAKRMLVNTGDIDTLIKAERYGGNAHDKIALGLELIQSGLYSLKQFERYCQETNPSIYFIVDWIGEYYTLEQDENNKKKILDLLISLATVEENFLQDDNRIFDLRNNKKIVGYDYYMRELANNEKYSEEIKSALIKKMMEAKNYKLMCSWLNFVVAKDNKMLVEELMTYSPNIVALVLNSLSGDLLDYALGILGQKDRAFIDQVMVAIIEYSNCFSVSKLDKIVEVLTYIRPDYRFQKQFGIMLVNKRSRYTLAIFRMYNFTQEEREKIYISFKDNGMDECCTIYGAYLMSGDKNKLLNAQESEESSKNLERLRTNGSES